MKILTVLGARPQFIKAAVVSREFAKHPDKIQEVIVHTGQHFDTNMSDIFFEEMKIPKPYYNLSINSLSHGAMTGKMLEKLDEIIISENPDYVMIYGDTNSTIAGALSAKKLHKKVIHVEAGLRSFNMDMPEEVNRILTDRISDILFCPTDSAVKNLSREGFEHFDCKIIKNGDVMQDSAIFYSELSSKESTIINKLQLKDKKYILATIHRQENTDDKDKIKTLIETLNKINEEINLVVPLHPRTNKILENNGLKPEFTVIDPVGYFDMIELIKNSSLVMTDSGGLQKEAFFFQRPCVTLREQTEWVELVENGFNCVTDITFESIYNSYKNMLNKKLDYNVNLYGNGNASKTIVENLLNI